MRGHPSCRSSQLRTKIIQRGGSVFLCGFLRFSSGVPEVVLWLSYGFSLVFLSFFRGFAMFFLFCFQLFPMVSIWFLHHSLWFYHRFHHRVTRITMKNHRSPAFPQHFSMSWSPGWCPSAFCPWLCWCWPSVSSRPLCHPQATCHVCSRRCDRQRCGWLVNPNMMLKNFDLYRSTLW